MADTFDPYREALIVEVETSWPDEYASFVEATRGHATANATLEDAAAALQIVQAAYGRRTA